MCLVLFEFLALLLLSCELAKDKNPVQFDPHHRLGENLLKLARDRNPVQFDPGH